MNLHDLISFHIHRTLFRLRDIDGLVVKVHFCISSTYETIYSLHSSTPKSKKMNQNDVGLKISLSIKLLINTKF